MYLVVKKMKSNYKMHLTMYKSKKHPTVKTTNKPDTS